MAGRPFDISKFRKSITKSIEGLGIGFNDPTDWVSTGNYALNYLISGDFNKGVPLGKVTVFAGESGAGKSFICAGNLIKAAQEQDIFPILIDTENALDEAWLQALGVDTSEDKLLKLNLAMIDDVAKTISEFMKEYKTMPEEQRTKILFVVDSLGMLLTPTDVNQFEAGEMKGDMGRKPKALTSLVRNCVNMFGSYNVGMVCTNHTYASQDPYDPDDKISGGQGFIYASSIVVAMKKMKLKEDEDGNKTTTVNGIRAGCKIMKTRYAKPFEAIQIHIPYETGMSPMSGLFDLLESKKLIQKEGNRYTYVDLNGEVHKYFRKEWNRNEGGIFDLVMKEFFDKEKLASKTIEIIGTTDVTE
jgi:RecA/RadA recombinase